MSPRLYPRTWGGLALGAAAWCAAASPAWAADPCPAYARAEEVGRVEAAALDEVSGLVASRRQPGVLWAHNDSGDAPRVFALDGQGRLLGTYTIEGAQAVDWEDLALIEGCEPARDCLVVADFGNNDNLRQDQTLYRVPEPQVTGQPGSPEAGQVEALSAVQIGYPYEEGAAEDNPDAEALLADPRDGALYVVTKESGRSRLLRLPQWRPGERVELEHVRAGPIPTVTAADWRPDGARVLVRNYASLYEFELSEGQALEDVFGLPGARRLRASGGLQDEAAAYAADGQALYTLAEGQRQPLMRYPCQPAPEPDMDPAPPVDMAPSALDMPPDLTPDMRAPAQPGMDPAPDLQRRPGAPDAGPLEPGPGNNSTERGCLCGVIAPAPAPWGAPVALLLLGGARRSRRQP